MGRVLTLATVAASAVLLTACNKPATENVAAPVMEPTANAMATPEPEGMGNAPAMMADNTTGNAMNVADNATDPHGGSGGH